MIWIIGNQPLSQVVLRQICIGVNQLGKSVIRQWIVYFFGVKPRLLPYFVNLPARKGMRPPVSLWILADAVKHLSCMNIFHAGKIAQPIAVVHCRKEDSSRFEKLLKRPQIGCIRLFVKRTLSGAL